jgi:hypothetical protein
MESAAFVVPVVVSRTPLQVVQQPRCGRFSAGVEQLPETPAKFRVGCFGDGMRHLSTALRAGRFSDGMEHSPGAAGSLRLGSFADGYQRTI